MGKLDSFDIQLLNLLQADALATAEALAREVPLSASAVTRRVRRLRAEGWIAADVAVVSAKLSDRRLRALVSVRSMNMRRNAASRRCARSWRQYPRCR